MKNIWVFIEHYNGKARKVSLELLNKAGELAAEAGQKVGAAVIGENTAEIIKEAAAYGADFVISVEGREYKDFTPDAYANAMAELIKKYEPDVVLFGSTKNGGDLTGKLTLRFNLGIAVDCTDVSINKETGEVAWVRPTFDGKLMAEITSPGRFPQMGAVRTGVFRKTDSPDFEKAVEIIKEDIKVSESDIRTKVIGFIEKIQEENTNLEEADIIVSGGKGLGSADGFKLMYELADVMGGLVGASKPVVEAGWISYAHQVGLTGKTVRPKIYVACGISGATPHIAGMSGSEIIIAINKDPDANIFEIANYGVVADLYEAVPVMIEEMKKRRAM